MTSSICQSVIDVDAVRISLCLFFGLQAIMIFIESPVIFFIPQLPLFRL